VNFDSPLPFKPKPLTLMDHQTKQKMLTLVNLIQRQKACRFNQQRSEKGQPE